MHRRRSLRIGGWVFVSFFVAVGLSLAYPGGPPALVDDVQNYGQHSAELTASETMGRDIDSAIVARVNRQHLKAELCGQLACGGMPLRDAADEYLRVIADDPELLARFRDKIPGPNDEQRVAVSLIRDTFTTTPMSASNRQSMLDQYRNTYGESYPLPVPTDSPSDVRPLLP